MCLFTRVSTYVAALYIMAFVHVAALHMSCASLILFQAYNVVEFQ